VEAAVFAGLEGPLFGIMMRSDRVDKRASLGISRGARSHMCLRQQTNINLAWHTRPRDNRRQRRPLIEAFTRPKGGDGSDVGLRTAGEGASGDKWRLAGTQAAVVDEQARD
jgi:hypothetical protein